MTKIRKPISIEEYNCRMDRIIEKSQNRPIDETLIKLLNEAGKWDIKIIGKDKKGDENEKLLRYIFMPKNLINTEI